MANLANTQSLFLLHQGDLDSAHVAIGKATRLCFQRGLNREQLWASKSGYYIHMARRVLHTTFCLDRRISQMCGCPPGMRSEEIAVDQPDGLADEDVYPDSPLPEPSITSLIQPYMRRYAAYAELVGTAWDTIWRPTVASGDRPALDVGETSLNSQLSSSIDQFRHAEGNSGDIQGQQDIVIRLVGA